MYTIKVLLCVTIFISMMYAGDVVRAVKRELQWRALPKDLPTREDVVRRRGW